jgi:hypothetical protein
LNYETQPMESPRIQGFKCQNTLGFEVAFF